MAQGYTNINHEHCGITTFTYLCTYPDRVFWNCNKCGIQFEASRMPDEKILIQPITSYTIKYGIAGKEYKIDDPVYQYKFLGIDHTRYETYLQWFMDKFIVDKEESKVEGEDIDSLFYTTATQVKYSQRKDIIPSILDLMKLYDKIYKKI